MGQKLRLVTKFFYGIGDMSTAAIVGVTGYLLNPFLLDVAGLTPLLGVGIREGVKFDKEEKLSIT